LNSVTWTTQRWQKIESERDQMATIEEELALAKQAKAVIEAKPRNETIEVLRKANQMAAAQMTTFSSAGPLNDARHKLGLALPPVIRALSKANQAKTRSTRPKVQSKIG
jgi:hypothetical protein